MFTPMMKAMIASPILALLLQPSFSTSQNANLRASFTNGGRVGAPRYTTALRPTCDANNVGALVFDTTLGGLVTCNGSSYVGGGSGSAAGGIQGVATASLPACSGANSGFVAFDTTLGQLVVCNGSSYVLKVGTTVLYSTATAVTTTGTVEETVGTYTLPASFLDANNQSISFVAAGDCAANANNKTVRAYFGATQITTFTLACNATGWRVVGEVFRITATTQATAAQTSFTGNSGLGVYNPAAETLSGTVALQIRLVTPTSSGDATMRFFRVMSAR